MKKYAFKTNRASLSPDDAEFEVELFTIYGGWGYELARPHPTQYGDGTQPWRREWRPWWTRPDAMRASKKAANSIKTTNVQDEAAKALRR